MSSPEVLDLSPKNLRIEFRNVCGFKEDGGRTTDSNGNAVHRYPSVFCMRYFVDKTCKTSIPLSSKDYATMLSRAEEAEKAEEVKRLLDKVSTDGRWMEQTKRDFDAASNAAEEAAKELESAQADHSNLLQALKMVELRMNRAILEKRSAEQIKGLYLNKYMTAKQIFEKTQQTLRKLKEN